MLEDKHLLERAELTANQRNMVKITLEEKTQVKKLLDWVDNILDKFDMEDKELILALQEQDQDARQNELNQIAEIVI